MDIEEQLMIKLIIQDLKHNTLLSGIEALGFEDQGYHNLDIMDMLAELMQVPTGEKRDSWAEIYLNFQDRAAKHYKKARNSELQPLAEECLRELKEFI